MKIIVRVKVNKTKEGVEENGTELIVWTKAPKHEGKANADIIKQIADYYGVARSAVTITAGHTAPIKRIEIQ